MNSLIRYEENLDGQNVMGFEGIAIIKKKLKTHKASKTLLSLFFLMIMMMLMLMRWIKCTLQLI